MQDNFCMKTSAIWQLIGYGLYALKIVIPLIIIILGIVDLVKVVVSNDEKSINKAVYTLIQRVIMGVCIFFVPALVSIFIGLISNITETSKNIEGCKTCLLDPISKECDRIKEQAKNSRS